MSLSRTSLRQFEAFSAVAELLSFGAAAERLSLTPSAISQLITELESALGFRLFERTTRKVALSAAGREFLGSAESVLKHQRLADVAAADLRNRAAGLVRVAAPMVIASSLLPAALREFSQQRPNVVVRIRDVPVEQLVDAVAAGDADLAIGPDRQSGNAVQRLPLFDSPWVLWCRPDHALAAKRSVTWAQLRDQPLVAAGRDHERSVAQMQAGAAEGDHIVPVDVVDHISTALGMAAEGLALTVSPAYVGVWADRMGLVMRRILGPEVMRQVCLYQPLQRIISPAAEGFGQFLQTSEAWRARAALRK